MSKLHHAITILIAILATDSPLVMAAESSNSDSLQYSAEFFTQFSPRTALDMVRQVPGFALQEVDEEKRGYAAAAGNVLIDGEYPSNKSQTLEDILQRIPADQVVRIELWRSDSGDVGSSRASTLANIVRSRSAGSGVWGVGAEYAQQHTPAPNGYASWTGRAGDVEYAVGGNSYSLQRELPSTHVLTDATGQIQERQIESSPRDFREYAINAEASGPVFGGILRATGQAYRSYYEQHNTLERTAQSGEPSGEEIAPYDESKRTVEFGSSFETAIASWKTTLAAIVNRTRFESDSKVSDLELQTGNRTDFQQLQVRETGEEIFRGTLSKRLSPTQEIEIGSEAARNTLDAALDLSGAANGEQFPIYIPNANLQLEETRWNGFVLHRWRSAPWSTEASLGAERSHLAFSGDSNLSVQLQYVKPSLQLARIFYGRHQWRIKVYREVGQLDFADFASVASLSDNVVNGGNPNLKPETSWRAEAALDLRFSALAASVRAYHYWVNDVVDLVPIATGDRIISAPGNIGSGTVDGVQVSLTVPLSSLLPRATLKIDATLQNDQVVDPLTHETRHISDFDRNKLKAQFRQDTQFHGFSWGVSYTRESAKALYRVDEIDRTRVSPSLDAFAEMPLTGSVRVNLKIVSAQGSPELRARTFYDQDRTNEIVSREDIERHPGHWWVITFSGAF